MQLVRSGKLRTDEVEELRSMLDELARDPGNAKDDPEEDR